MPLSKFIPHPEEDYKRRLDHVAEPLLNAIRALYGEGDAGSTCFKAIMQVCRNAYEERSSELKELDIKREKAQKLWFSDEKMIGYMCYPDRFAGNFEGVRAKLPYLEKMGVTYLHMLQVLKARKGDSDGGFAIEDYLATNENLGTLDDLESLTREMRAAGISLCLDFVFNHTAQEHEWARRAAAGERYYQDFYYFHDNEHDVATFEKNLEQVFPQSAPGNFTYLPECSKWVMTTFYPFQWDLNYSNPVVLVEMVKVLLQLANKGIEVFRLDAAIFTWKEKGTNCRNLPQTHALLKVFRAVASIVAPAIALKAEAMAGARHITKYLGSEETGDQECQLAYHNAAMAALWDCLATQNTSSALQMLKALPAKPKATAWIHYIRCHDDIGWHALMDDTGAAWAAKEAHLNYLWRFYAGEVEGSFARGQKFQAAPGEPFAGSNGALASLAGLEKALLDENPQLQMTAVNRILLLYSIIMALDGIPLIYMGDEVALLNDYDYARESGCEDGRWLHRPFMPDTFDHFSVEHKQAQFDINQGLTALILARRGLPSLAPDQAIEYLVSGNNHLFTFTRSEENTKLLVIANFSSSMQVVERGFIVGILGTDVVDINPLKPESDFEYKILPYQCQWLTASSKEV